jgi:hypothetical protein
MTDGAWSSSSIGINSQRAGARIRAIGREVLLNVKRSSAGDDGHSGKSGSSTAEDMSAGGKVSCWGGGGGCASRCHC